MRRAGQEVRAAELREGLAAFAREQNALPGVDSPDRMESLVRQLIDSQRRIKYTALLSSRSISERRMNPSDDLFDPIRGAILANRKGNHDEACWLVFLSVHFGHNAKSGWRLLRDVYGRLGQGQPWTWQTIADSVDDFLAWLDQSEGTLRNGPGAFGNHRKFESYGTSGTGETLATYVEWVAPPRSHAQLFDGAVAQAAADPAIAFNALYESLACVSRFGRLARFDYLCLVARLGLAAIKPGTPYLQGSTGPLRGARLLFGDSPSAGEADRRLAKLGTAMALPMQAIEDALCNWQKSPDDYKSFG